MSTQQSRRPENPETAAVSLAAASMVDEATDKPTTRLLWLYRLADASGVPHPVMACAVAIARRSYPQAPSKLDVDKLAAATGYAALTVRQVVAGLKRNGWLELDYRGYPQYVVCLGDDGRRTFREVPTPDSYHLAIGSPVWIGPGSTSIGGA